MEQGQPWVGVGWKRGLVLVQGLQEEGGEELLKLGPGPKRPSSNPNVVLLSFRIQSCFLDSCGM